MCGEERNEQKCTWNPRWKGNARRRTQPAWMEEEDRENTQKQLQNDFVLTIFFSSDMQCSEGVPVVFQNCWKNPRLRKKNCTYLRLERIYILSVARAGATTAAKEAAEEVPLTSCAIRAFLKRLNVWRDQKRRTDLLCICSHVWSDLFLFTITRRNRKWCRSARIALHPHEAWRTMSNVGRRWGC